MTPFPFSHGVAGGLAVAGGVEYYPPVVRNVTVKEDDTSATTHSVGWGAGDADDVLLMLVNGAASTSYTMDVPTGWSSRYNVTQGDLRARAFVRSAPSASAGSVNVTISAGQRVSALVYRLANVDDEVSLAEAIVAGGAAGGTSTGPNPGSLSIPWGASQPSLVLAVAHSAAGGSVSYPSSYTNGQTAWTGVFNNFHARTSVARRVVEAASEDPGAFTLGHSVLWRAATIAIRGGTTEVIV